MYVRDHTQPAEIWYGCSGVPAKCGSLERSCVPAVPVTRPAEYGLVWLQPVPAPKPMPGGLKPGPEPPPPEVTVARPVSREVPEYQEFTGRIEAAQSVELRARVTGYLVKTLSARYADTPQLGASTI